MCILMLWMASARYYVHTKNHKIKKYTLGVSYSPLEKIQKYPGTKFLSILDGVYSVLGSTQTPCTN